MDSAGRVTAEHRMAEFPADALGGGIARLGPSGGREEIVQRVFELASRVTLLSDGGKPMDGDNFLVEVFEGLGATKEWPAPGSRDWTRLRRIALRKVVARLAREGLLDGIAVGYAEGSEGETETTAAKDEGSASHADGNGERATVGENPRAGFEAYGAMIRRGQRNPTGWFRLVNTPKSVLGRPVRSGPSALS